MAEMDRGNKLNVASCCSCGDAYTLPEDGDVESNLPCVLLCSHVYCASCLLSLQCNGVIICPECEVESAVPKGGECSLQEDSRIISLIYTAKMIKNKIPQIEGAKDHSRNKLAISTGKKANTEDVKQPADTQNIEKVLDEALRGGAENLAQLEHIHETLTAVRTKEAKRERDRLEREIQQAVDKALYAVHNWRNMQLNQLTKLEAQFSTSQEQVCCVQERIKALQIAIQKAREVRRFPFLEQYCSVDEVLKTLQTPVDDQSFNMKCAIFGSGLSCIFRSEGLSQSLSLCLKMEVSEPKCASQSSFNGQLGDSSRENRKSKYSPPSRYRLSQKQDPKIAGAKSAVSWSSSPCSTSHQLHSLSCQNSGTPEVIVEEQGTAPPPTGPELANDKWRIYGKKRDHFKKNRNVTMWVVVTHIINPSHFYVRYVAEKRENEALSRKINKFCHLDTSHFTLIDTLETGSLIFVKWNQDLWCRAKVVEIMQNGCMEAVKVCPVNQLASIQVFFLDYGFTKTITIQSEEGATESSMKALNNQLRKVNELVKGALHYFSPQAIRCSLKDLVPYDLTKGWSKMAQVEFQNIVGSAAVEMRPLGQDSDSLLVDLKKSPMDQSSDVPISVREYLVFIEVARFYSPLTVDRKPLLYYPPVYPKLNREISAVVSHINNPANFYIQQVKNMESLLLSAKLQDTYNTLTEAEDDKLRVYCPVIGQACVALYDKLWYRAQVIGHPGARRVEVQYVDFGNISIISITDVRKIKDEFFALPSMAIHCSLSDVIPLNGTIWTEACTNRFISVAHQKLVTIVATAGTTSKNDPLPVRMFESGLNAAVVNIAELLVKEGLACFKQGRFRSENVIPPVEESVIWDPPLELDSAPKETEEQTEDVLEFNPQLKLPAQRKDLKVRVSHVNSPSSFYVQLTQYNTHLTRIYELLKQVFKVMEPEDVTWKTDMYCAAHINGVWERGQICGEISSSNTAEVRRCDHGNTVKLNVSNLRPLPSSLMGSFALECTLTDIRPAGGQATWTATACDLISYYLTGASAIMNIKELTGERPVPVTLFCSNKTGQLVSIADFLVSEGLALRERKPRGALAEKPKGIDALPPVKGAQAGDHKVNTHPAPPVITLPSFPPITSTCAAPKPLPRTFKSAEKVMTQLYLPPELPCPGHIQMSISAVGEDGLIYMRTQDAECQLEQLKERIQQSMKTLPTPKLYTWKSVQGCVVIGSDMRWYRGQLLEVVGEHVKVQYIDYGFVEDVPVVHVYPVQLCRDVPQLCLPCKLHDIIPNGGTWQWDSVALLREIFLNRSLDIQVMELPADPRDPITVEISLDGLSLKRILCHHEHTSMERTDSGQEGHSSMSSSILDEWDTDTEALMEPLKPIQGPFISPKMPQKGEQFEVRVKHLLTPNELFLWPLKEAKDEEMEGETLAEALTRINENINSLPELTNFSHDNPCLAQYSDGKYYRAKLVRFISVEPIMILVHHVDFGSDDTLPTSKIREMPVELLGFPVQALKVKVAGFKAPSVSSQEVVLPYSPQWSVKAMMEMIDLLHTSITLSVVACEPELTVLLYDKSGELLHLPLVNQGLAELD